MSVLVCYPYLHTTNNSAVPTQPKLRNVNGERETLTEPMANK